MTPGRFALLWTAILLATLIADMAVGAGDLSTEEILTVLTHRLRGHASPLPPVSDAIVWDLRLPRALLAAVIGAALGAAGTLTQGLFRNPMASPGVLGISMGAAAAAVVGFSLELDQGGLWVTPVLAALGAGLSLALLFALVGPGTSMTTLLLSGVALGALFSAVTTLMLALDTEHWDLGIKVVRWLMGSFESRTWIHLGWALPPVAIGLAAAVWVRVDLDVLALGPDTAASLGVDLSRLRVVTIVAVGLLVGAATALTGVIGFVGLIVPHVARLLVGASHRVLLPHAALLGAITLLVVDAATRSVTSVVLPPGVITSLMGAPFFLWLLRRHTGGLA